MASSDLYEMRFEWPHPEPTTVIVTGTFDQWSRSVELKRAEQGFVASVQVPWAEKIKYKFIVDGRWLTQPGQPTETDPGGFVNNVYFTPPKPVTASEPAPAEELNGDATHESAPVAEDPIKPVEEAPVVEEKVEKKEEEDKVVEQPAASPKPRRVSIPIVPVNAVEHNTIGLSNPPPPVPDYVLPPPRARSASPPPVVTETKKVVEVAPAPAAEPEPVKLHEVESAPEDAVTAPPEIPLEEKKLEEEAHVPLDCSDTVKDPEPVKVEEEAKEEPKAIVAPEPIPDPTPSTPPPALKLSEEKPKESKPIPSALPTPPATPASKKDRGSQSPPATPTPTGSPSSSRFGTSKSRKKRTSIFGKIKEIFHHDKEKVPK